MEGSSSSGLGTKSGVEDWEAFCEFLRNLQPPRSLSDCNVNDVVEYLRRLPFDRVEAVVDNLSANTFKTMFGSQKENPFCSQIVRTFLMEFAEEQTSEKEFDNKKLSPFNVPGEYKQNLCTRHSDVPREHLLSKFPDPTSQATSSETLELREELKEVLTPLQLRLPDINPISFISCGDDQESEETYFISYILNELGLHGFTPCRYDLIRSTVTENPVMVHKSRVCIMIISISKFNARFRECMDNFSTLMGHLEADKVALIPVYFKSSRNYSIRAQLGNSIRASQVQKWWEAMIKSSSVYNSYHYIKGDEVLLAKSIVKDVCFLLSSETSRNLIGIDLLLQSILPLLQFPQPSTPQIVGLWGMAGIGKTTIAREIFRIQAESYDFSYFLPDFDIMCQIKGLSQLRDEFFPQIFGEEKGFIDVCDTKLTFTWDRFFNKRVLVILDGVINARDAEVLVGGFGWFSSGHTIILTSRNKQVLLQCNAKELYEIPKLSESDSLRLCCQNATEQNWKGKVPLISELVNYASGVPLALRVLGSSVQKECINNEKKHLRRLRQHPPNEIQNTFRRSFTRLHDNEKNIFLDLACFFIGEKRHHVVNMLDGSDFYVDLGIYGLIDESLISLEDNMIEMPKIFQDMGRFFVCQENKEAHKRSRLWDSDDITNVLKNNSGTEAIEGIFLDMSGLSCELSPTVFERMHRLRLLKLHCPTSENSCKICLPQGLHSLPDELRLLHWERYPLVSLPRNFNPNNLVELNMPYSNMKKLWKGTKNLEKLKRIILSHSRQLTKFPRLLKAKNLEHIDLEGCTSLVKVNSSILHHHKLTFLSLKNCSHLRIMPTTVHLESLEVLNLSGCSELAHLQDFSQNLKELYLAGTAITEMPSSMEDLTRLSILDLENCERLQHLPLGISNLKALYRLKLFGCLNLKSHPEYALFLRHSQCFNKDISMEESVPLKLHSAIQESRDGVEELVTAFKYPSNNKISKERSSQVTTTLSAKRPSSMDPGELSSLGYMVPSLKIATLDDLEDYDLFGGGGSIELEKDPHDCINNSFPRMSFVDSNVDNGMPRNNFQNGMVSIAGEHPSRTLFVRNINSNIEDSELQALFEQFGDIRTLYTACKLRGFVMIIYYDIRASRAAMRALQSKLLKGRKLDIHFSVPKDPLSEKNVNQGTLVVSNLNPVSNRELANIMGAYGEIKEIREIPNRRHHKFIEFFDVRSADAALKALNMAEIAGKRIKLEHSRPVGARRNMMLKMNLELEQDDSPSYLNHESPLACYPAGNYWFNSGIDHPLQSFSKSPIFGNLSPAKNIRYPEFSGRRTRISGSLKKLHELVPNMEKQTSTSDMLDAAVDYINDLDNQYKILKEKRANCKCMNKEKKAIYEAKERVQRIVFRNMKEALYEAEPEFEIAKTLKKKAIYEAEAEFEIAKSLGAQLEGSKSFKPEPVDDVAVEDFFDPQLLSALKAIGTDNPVNPPSMSTTETTKAAAKPNPGKESNNISTQERRSQLEELIKAEKVKALTLKHAGRISEALYVLRRAKFYEKNINDLASN